MITGSSWRLRFRHGSERKRPPQMGVTLTARPERRPRAVPKEARPLRAAVVVAGSAFKRPSDSARRATRTAAESNDRRGQRSVWDGRGHVCAVLYMATMRAVRCNPCSKRCTSDCWPSANTARWRWWRACASSCAAATPSSPINAPGGANQLDNTHSCSAHRV